MDRETGNGADLDTGAQTHAGGSAAAAETPRRRPAGPGPAAAGPDDRTEAGLPDDASAEAITQPITGGPATGKPQPEGGGQQGRSPHADAPDTDAPDTDAPDAGAEPAGLRDAGAGSAGLRDAGAGPGRFQDAGAESATRTPPAGTLPTGTLPTGTPATRAPARRSAASLPPARRVLVKAGDQRLARPDKKEQAGAARRSQTSRGEQPPRRLVPVLRPIFPGLATDPRLPMWIARTLTATAVCLAVMIWQNWRLGLTAAAAVIILDIIYRSRTTSVIPAAVRVTSAQRRSRRRLALLRGRGYIALNARAIPGSDSVIDHLVIGPPGVYALDSERWDRRLPVRTAASGRLYHGPFGQEDRLEHAIWEAAQASSLLSASLGRPISVRPAMVIYGPTIPWTVASLRDVDVLAGRRLRKYLRRQARQPGPRLDADQVRQVHAAASRALPPAR